jgi:hypothetical protein
LAIPPVETRAILDRMDRVLRAAGSSPAHVRAHAIVTALAGGRPDGGRDLPQHVPARRGIRRARLARRAESHGQIMTISVVDRWPWRSERAQRVSHRTDAPAKRREARREVPGEAPRMDMSLREPADAARQ